MQNLIFQSDVYKNLLPTASTDFTPKHFKHSQKCQFVKFYINFRLQFKTLTTLLHAQCDIFNAATKLILYSSYTVWSTLTKNYVCGFYAFLFLRYFVTFFRLRTATTENVSILNGVKKLCGSYLYELVICVV